MAPTAERGAASEFASPRPAFRVTPAPPRSARALRRVHDALLFACAYPANRVEWEQANLDLRELATRARAMAATPRGAALQNSGIAGTPIVASFSLAISRWLVGRFGDAVTLSGVEADPTHVMAVLDPALDPLEREVGSELPLRWVAWRRRHLGTGPAAQLRHLLALVERLPGGAALHEAMFASMRVYLRWATAADAPLLTTGRFAVGEPVSHPAGLRRRARLADAWRAGRPHRRRLRASGQQALLNLARGTLAGLLAETDPFTDANRAEIELHELGGGLSVGLYATMPGKKLALEAYIGYLLLKNHVPVAYGGAWVLGRQARFGLNVLPPFRGGESAVILAQLLRAYAWRFGLKLFLVEPYQLGRGNPDGIRSGAFWFYWRLGFRPLQPALRVLATTEAQRLRTPGTRTPAALLRRLAESTMAWETPLGASWSALDIEQIGARVSRHVVEEFDGDRGAAQRTAIRSLGYHEPRLAVLLTAIAPPGGWSSSALARLATIMAGKDRAEMNQAVALGRHRGLMRALARASVEREGGKVSGER